MFKKLALFFFIIVLSTLIYFKYNNKQTKSPAVSLEKAIVLSPQISPRAESTTPESVMLEARQQKVLQEDWSEAQVDWLLKHNFNEEDAQALAGWQDQLLDELDLHPEQKELIQKKFQIKLEKILGKKNAQSYLKFKGDYDEKIK
jgi:hypothetical protein